MRYCAANERSATGESDGWLKPMLTTLNWFGLSSLSRPLTASCRLRVVVGQISKQPV